MAGRLVWAGGNRWRDVESADPTATFEVTPEQQAVLMQQTNNPSAGNIDAPSGVTLQDATLQGAANTVDTQPYAPGSGGPRFPVEDARSAQEQLAQDNAALNGAIVSGASHLPPRAAPGAPLPNNQEVIDRVIGGTAGADQISAQQALLNQPLPHAGGPTGSATITTHGNPADLEALRQQNAATNQANQATIDPQMEVNRLQAEAAQRQSEEEHRINVQRQMLQDKIDSATADQLEAHDEAVRAMQAGNINPDRLFSREGGISRFNASMAMAMAGFGAMLGGHPEAAGIAVDFIKTRLQQDIAAQEREMDNRRDVAGQRLSALQVMQQIHHDQTASSNALYEAQLQEVNHRLQAGIQAASSPLQRATLQAVQQGIAFEHQLALTKLSTDAVATQTSIHGSMGAVTNWLARNQPGVVPQAQGAPRGSGGQRRMGPSAQQAGPESLSGQQAATFVQQNPLQYIMGVDGHPFRIPAGPATQARADLLAQARNVGQASGQAGGNQSPAAAAIERGRFELPPGISFIPGIDRGEASARLWASRGTEGQNKTLEAAASLRHGLTVLQQLQRLVRDNRELPSISSPAGETINRQIQILLGQLGRAAGTGGVMSEGEYARIRQTMDPTHFVANRSTEIPVFGTFTRGVHEGGNHLLGITRDRQIEYLNNLESEIREDARHHMRTYGLHVDGSFFTDTGEQ